jgi:hypothetical protein
MHSKVFTNCELPTGTRCKILMHDCIYRLSVQMLTQHS